MWWRDDLAILWYGEQMMRLDRTLLVVICAAASGLCPAQEMTHAGAAMVQVKVVRNAPFSAQVLTEYVEVLADGNRIVRRETALLARDSEGRTSRKQNLLRSSLGSTEAVVFIQDPVEGAAYVLDPRSRSARKIRALPAESATAINSIVAKATEADKKTIRSESLGAQVIEGVQAEGTRILRTIPPGEIGNERPLEIASETWYSPELQTIVMSRNRDARQGESTYKLIDIQRGEPGRTLFEVPADYTIREEPRPLGSPGVKNSNDR